MDKSMSKHAQWSQFHEADSEFALIKEISKTVLLQNPGGKNGKKKKKKEYELNHLNIFSSSSEFYLLHNISNIESISRGKSHMD